MVMDFIIVVFRMLRQESHGFEDRKLGETPQRKVLWLTSFNIHHRTPIVESVLPDEFRAGQMKREAKSLDKPFSCWVLYLVY